MLTSLFAGNSFDVIWSYIPGPGGPNTVGNLTLRIQEMVSGGLTRNYWWPVNIFSYLCPSRTTPGCLAWFGASAGTGGSIARHQLLTYSYTNNWASVSPSGTGSSSVTPSNTASVTSSPAST